MTERAAATVKGRRKPKLGEPDPPIDIDMALRNILQLLQARPERYRLFGVWWWPVKALLRENYTTENLYMLGDYIDSQLASMVPSGSLQVTFRDALLEYRRNAVYPRAGGMVETPDGEIVRLFDEDANI